MPGRLLLGPLLLLPASARCGARSPGREHYAMGGPGANWQPSSRMGRPVVCSARFGAEETAPGIWRVCAVALGACGGGERQDENEPEGDYKRPGRQRDVPRRPEAGQALQPRDQRSQRRDRQDDPEHRRDRQGLRRAARQPRARRPQPPRLRDQRRARRTSAPSPSPRTPRPRAATPPTSTPGPSARSKPGRRRSSAGTSPRCGPGRYQHHLQGGRRPRRQGEGGRSGRQQRRRALFIGHDRRRGAGHPHRRGRQDGRHASGAALACRPTLGRIALVAGALHDGHARVLRVARVGPRPLAHRERAAARVADHPLVAQLSQRPARMTQYRAASTGAHDGWVGGEGQLRLTRQAAGACPPGPVPPPT